MGNNEDELTENLTPQQELFCIHYVQNDGLRGNGTLAYNEAFELDLYEKDKAREIDADEKEVQGTSEYEKTYNVCSVGASKLLRMVKIRDKNREIFNGMLKDNVVDSRLAEIIVTGKDTDSIAAIKEYNKMGGRVIEKKEVTHKGTGFGNLSTEELLKIREEGAIEK